MEWHERMERRFLGAIMIIVCVIGALCMYGIVDAINTQAGR